LFGFGPPHILAALNDIRLTGAGFLSGSFILEKVKHGTAAYSPAEGADKPDRSVPCGRICKGGFLVRLPS
jgi:hypothetical protein